MSNKNVQGEHTRKIHFIQSENIEILKTLEYLCLKTFLILQKYLMIKNRQIVGQTEKTSLESDIAN